MRSQIYVAFNNALKLQTYVWKHVGVADKNKTFHSVLTIQSLILANMEYANE